MDCISAVVITQDEARNIGRCLESLRGVADEVVVVDSGSTDDTETICRTAGARFVPHAWEGFSGQKNYANSLATHPWILSIDADEALSDELRASLLSLKQSGFDTGKVYSVARLNNYCGQWLKHGGWYPDTHVRLWRNGVATWDGVVHEQLHFSELVEREMLQGALLHYTYYTVDEHVRRTVKYATLAGDKAYAQGRRCGMGAVLWKPVGTFLKNYLLKGGFRDGSMGFVSARISAFYTLVKYARLFEKVRSKS